MKNKKYKRLCPNCNRELYYSTERNFKLSINKNTMCIQCRNTLFPNMKGHKHTQNTKKVLSKKSIDLWKNEAYRSAVISKLKGNVPHNKLPIKIVKCKCCDTPFEVPINSKVKYYPKHYQKLMLSDKNPAKKLEVRYKIQQTLLKTYKEHPEILENRKPSGINQYSNYYTSIEKLIANSLCLNNISHMHNFKIGKYFSDFVILNNIIIECDGEYWHKDKDKDNNKDAYLMSRGFFVFRLSEKIIHSNPNKCVENIINIVKYIGYEDQMKIYIENNNVNYSLQYSGLL